MTHPGLFKVRSKVWQYPGMAAWHFVNVSKKDSKEIREDFGASRRGFGSIPVVVTLGETSWETSIFPDKKSETYLLPLKASVRKKEGIVDGQTVNFSIEIVL